MLRVEQEEREARALAPWAMKSADSRGRTHPESEHPYRTAYQRDRDRVIHCKAFRRLEYKTQVFLNHEGDQEQDEDKSKTGRIHFIYRVREFEKFCEAFYKEKKSNGPLDKRGMGGRST